MLGVHRLGPMYLCRTPWQKIIEQIGNGRCQHAGQGYQGQENARGTAVGLIAEKGHCQHGNGDGGAQQAECVQNHGKIGDDGIGNITQKPLADGRTDHADDGDALCVDLIQQPTAKKFGNGEDQH